MKAEVVKSRVETTRQEHCDQKYPQTYLVIHRGDVSKYVRKQPGKIYIDAILEWTGVSASEAWGDEGCIHMDRNRFVITNPGDSGDVILLDQREADDQVHVQWLPLDRDNGSYDWDDSTAYDTVYGVNAFERKKEKLADLLREGSGQGTSREEGENAEQKDGTETVSDGKCARVNEDNDEVEPAATIDVGDWVEDARGQKEGDCDVRDGIVGSMRKLAVYTVAKNL